MFHPMRQENNKFKLEKKADEKKTILLDVWKSQMEIIQTSTLFIFYTLNFEAKMSNKHAT